MRKKICFSVLGLMLALGAVYHFVASGEVPSNQVIEYAGDTPGSHVIVVVLANGVTQGQAEAFAKKRASQITVDGGDQYFHVISKEKIQATVTQGGGMPPPSNIYQELIVEDNFCKDCIQRDTQVPRSQVYPAFRYTFAVDSKKKLESIDACKYVPCSK